MSLDDDVGLMHWAHTTKRRPLNTTGRIVCSGTLSSIDSGIFCQEDQAGGVVASPEAIFSVRQ